MTEFPVPDCLVLKLEEYESISKKLDTTVYIFMIKKSIIMLLEAKEELQIIQILVFIHLYLKSCIVWLTF